MSMHFLAARWSIPKFQYPAGRKTEAWSQLSDNGVGYDTSKVVGSAFGIGIKNVDDRIKLTYGNAYGQTTKTKPGEGVEVIIRQPLVLSEEEWEEKYV